MDDANIKLGHEPHSQEVGLEPGAPGPEVDSGPHRTPEAAAEGAQPDSAPEFKPPTPWQFQLRVIKALMLRNMVGRYGYSRMGPLVGLMFPLLLIVVILIVFEVRRRLVPEGFSVPVFVITGYPFWYGFIYIYQGAVTGGSRIDPLLMFPQITQLDLIIANLLLEVATNTVVFILMAAFIIVVLHAQFPADPGGVILLYWSCAWFGSGFGMAMSAVERILPTVTRYFNMGLRFGLYISGVIFMADQLPSWTLPYLRWNPLLHAVEGARQLWSYDYQSPVFDPVYIVICCFVVTAAGFILERLTRRYVG